MTTYILYRTHKGKNARYIIKRAEDKPPCACMWEEHTRSDDLMNLITEKQNLEREQNN